MGAPEKKPARTRPGTKPDAWARTANAGPDGAACVTVKDGCVGPVGVSETSLQAVENTSAVSVRDRSGFLMGLYTVQR